MIGSAGPVGALKTEITGDKRMRKKYPYQKVFSFIFVIFSCIAALLFGVYVFFEVQSDLDPYIPKDAAFFIHLKKPVFGIGRPYEKAVPSFLDLNGIVGADNIFERDIYPWISDEAAFVYLTSTTSAPIIFLETKNFKNIQSHFSEYSLRSLGKSIYVFLPQGADDSFFNKQTAQSAPKNVLKRAGAARFYLNFEKIKESMPKDNQILSNVLGRMPPLAGFMKFSQGAWEFSAYPEGSFINVYDEFSGARTYLNTISRDTFFAKGVRKDFLGQFMASADTRSQAQEYFYEHIYPTMSEYFDFAFDFFQKDSPAYLIGAEIRNRDEESFLLLLKNWLSYVYPQKLEKILNDGTRVYEEFADPDSLVIEYKSSLEKAIRIPYEKKSFYVYFENGRFFFGNDFPYLIEHRDNIFRKDIENSSVYCSDENFSRVFLYAPKFESFQNFGFLKIFKKDIRIFFTAQPKFFSGCIL